MKRLMRTGRVALLGLLAACGAGAGPQGPSAATPGPTLVVERFLQAANANDLQTMTQLFGTPDKTIVELDGRQQAEQRMFVLASLLRHEDFAIQGQRSVPGRGEDAAEVAVELTKDGKRVRVPLVVVRRNTGGWVVERVDVLPLTKR